MRKMKIKDQDYQLLKESAFTRLDADDPARANKYYHADWTPVRFRWDVLCRSKYPIGQLYSYLNNNHIDTALRSIMDAYYGTHSWAGTKD